MRSKYSNKDLVKLDEGMTAGVGDGFNEYMDALVNDPRINQLCEAEKKRSGSNRATPEDWAVVNKKVNNR